MRKGAGERACLTFLFTQEGTVSRWNRDCTETGFASPSGRLDFTSKASRLDSDGIESESVEYQQLVVLEQLKRLIGDAPFTAHECRVYRVNQPARKPGAAGGRARYVEVGGCGGIPGGWQRRPPGRAAGERAAVRGELV